MSSSTVSQAAPLFSPSSPEVNLAAPPLLLVLFTPAPGIFPTTSPPFEAPGDISCSARSSALLLLLLLLIENTFFFLSLLQVNQLVSRAARAERAGDSQTYLCSFPINPPPTVLRGESVLCNLLLRSYQLKTCDSQLSKSDSQLQAFKSWLFA